MSALPRSTDPRIGVIVRNGLTLYYAFTQGFEQNPHEGTLNEIEEALCVPLSEPATSQAPQAPALALDPISRPSRGDLQRYAVSITPDVVLYSGTSTFGETVEYVDARNARDAQKDIRRRLREVNGRHGPRYTITAKLDLP